MLAAPHALTSRRPAVASLVLSNVVPLVGVLFFGWSLWMVMVLYWLENAVIGVYAWMRIVSAGSGGMRLPGRLGLAAFFTVHYGGFWLGHGAFLSGTFRTPGLDLDAVGVGVLSLVASHGVSFVANYLRRERTTAMAGAEMFKPYGRVVLLHVVILLGGVIVEAGGSPVWALALLVVLKTGLDLAVHLVGHWWRMSGRADAKPTGYDGKGWFRDMESGT